MSIGDFNRALAHVGHDASAMVELFPVILDGINIENVSQATPEAIHGWLTDYHDVQSRKGTQ